MSFWDDISSIASDGINAVVGAGTTVVDTIAGEVTSVWSSTSDEAKIIADSIESTGVSIDQVFIDGADIVVNGCVNIYNNDIVPTLVSCYEYIDSHQCDLGVSSILSTYVMANIYTGSETIMVGSMLSAFSSGDDDALKVSSKVLGKSIAESTYSIINACKVTDEETYEKVVSFILYKAFSASPVGGLVSYKDGLEKYVAGAIIVGITSFVCDGKVPGGDFIGWSK